MNDQHPHAGYVTDATQTTGSFAVDPLFGGYTAGYETGAYDMAYGAGHDAGQSGYDAYAGHQTDGTLYAQQQTQGSQQGYAAYAEQSGQWDTGSYASYTATGQWDATAWNEAQQTGQYEAAAFAQYDATAQWTTPGHETGAYDATAWNQTAPAQTTTAPDPVVPHQYTPSQDYAEQTGYAGHSEHSGYQDQAYTDATTSYDTGYDSTGYVETAAYGDSTYDDTATYDETVPYNETSTYDETATYEVYPGHPEHQGSAADEEPEHGAAAPDAFHDAETMVALEIDPADLAPGQTSEQAARPVRRAAGGNRGRRRTPAKRSALLTVAVPSACVMGVAGIAAASVGGLTDSASDQKDDTTSLAAADPASVKPVAANSKLDTQLAALSADARDFGERASRTQERIDLKLRQDAERKKREEEAARKEALRPKYLLPVKLHQLSARFGQAGVNWMSLHTGIDFPVQYGTPVMSATDGTVRTQWNSAYGNMAIVTDPNGTETWYCHLSSTKIRSGKVKAGEVIAYSGNSGNSTGPHLHFEVRPGGGAAIDPLPWLRSHGLDPTS